LILNRIRINEKPKNVVVVVWMDSWIEVVVGQMGVGVVIGKEEKGLCNVCVLRGWRWWRYKCWGWRWKKSRDDGKLQIWSSAAANCRSSAVVNYRRLTSAEVNCREGISIFYWCFSAIYYVWTTIFQLYLVAVQVKFYLGFGWLCVHQFLRFFWLTLLFSRKVSSNNLKYGLEISIIWSKIVPFRN